MSVISRDKIGHPALRRRTVEAPELGGDVVVRGLTLTERLTLSAEESHRLGAIAQSLAWCVLADDGQPVFSREEWDATGAQQMDLCLRLWAVVQDISLLNPEAVEKKSESTPS